MCINIFYSRRGYIYAANWRQRNEGTAPSFFYTKTYNRPLDVPSDDEPEYDEELEFWQGRRIERLPLSADQRHLYLGSVKYFKTKLMNKKLDL